MLVFGLDGWKGDDAVAKVTEALSHIHRYSDSRFARGRTYHESRKRAAALEDFTRVVAERPERTDCHYHRGLALWNLKWPVEALTEPDHDDAVGQHGV